MAKANERYAMSERRSATSDKPFAISDKPLAISDRRPGLFLLIGPRNPNRRLLAAAVRLAYAGQPVRVIDGCNSFDGYFAARLARRLSPEPARLLNRITLSRAFTCFQLAQRISQGGGAGPLIVLGMLETFYDESVPLAEVKRLLAESLRGLRRWARSAPVIVGAGEPQGPQVERRRLLDLLRGAADRVYTLAEPAEEALAGKQMNFGF